ncbi:hypothetical protein K435DRAFT_757117 [Dendrothele bispora CBS 962.96]|uniref:Chromo domain-containing protein n=1 Tax=Dendrothele bispora (strain CBS 962.96) TaxID=1314807 RepID=A0A4S8LW06_DENBC|nr:hypothetical protein K435DRAFT_757117 [Dendrothele bispora CBS 962.96]
MPLTRSHQSCTPVSATSELTTLTDSLLNSSEHRSTSWTSDEEIPAPKRTPRSTARRNYANPYSIPHPKLSRAFSKTESPTVSVVIQSRPKTVKIRGHTLCPTNAFDTFWYWCAERKIIDDRRRAGQPFPWTENTILQEYPFCNTFRVLDKVSQYLIREVIEKGSQEPTELVFRIALFSVFTKPATWELLTEKLGPLEWVSYNRKDYQRVLSEAKSNKQTLYTGSFQKPGPSFEYKEVFMNHLLLLEVMMDKDLPGRIQNAKYIAEIHGFIESLPGMGPFNTFQLLLNLSYSDIIHFSNMDFVVPGLGAVSGLVKLFGSSITQAKVDDPDVEVAVIRWLANHQTEHFDRLKLKPPRLGPKARLMELADIEHALCEVDKYCRLAHPEIMGTSNRKEFRRRYKMSDDPYPAIPVLPKAWSNPTRRTERRWPGGAVPKCQKQYAIDRLLDHRRMEDGSVEFLVHWYGYNRPGDDTWEPEASLLEDSPLMVKEYREKIGFLVDYIGKKRKFAKGREFLVVWSAYDVKDATWEPESQLSQDAPKVLQSYLRSQK